MVKWLILFLNKGVVNFIQIGNAIYKWDETNS